MFSLIGYQQRDSLAKNYETTNDLVITLEIPKSDYKNPHGQNILSFGIWFMDTLTDGVVGFATRGQTRLRPHTIRNVGNQAARIRTYPDAVQFIKAGLTRNDPVVLLVTLNSYIANSEPEVQMSDLHFVTITAMTEIKMVEVTRDRRGGIVKREDLGVVDYELRTSDWGLRRHIPSLKQMWEASSAVVQAARIIPDVREHGLASVSLARFSLA